MARRPRTRSDGPNRKAFVGSMRLRGGYNFHLAGRPHSFVAAMPEPTKLYLPLWSRRFRFGEVFVRAGDRVRQGQILARDKSNHGVPLLSPRAGVVQGDGPPNHITLGELAREEEASLDPREILDRLPQKGGSAPLNRHKLLMLGAWQFVAEAHTGLLPDPFKSPQAVIVSTLHLEPFVARGDVQLGQRLACFTRGLEQIQTLLEYQPIYLVLPETQSALGKTVREKTRGYAWARPVYVPLRYPYDHFAVLARHLGLKAAAASPVWAMRTEGVLAFDRALTLSRPCTVRLISLGGSAVEKPSHLRAMAGYPLRELAAGRCARGPVRLIDGGALTGRAVTKDEWGLSAECDGLTVLPGVGHRRVLSFMRPGWGERSHSRCFLSSLRPAFRERLTTEVRGERRACVSCGYCEEVCPAGIMPHLIHKLLYQNELEEAERSRVDLCVGCGLCSYVCPSKIELSEQFQQAQQELRELAEPQGAQA